MTAERVPAADAVGESSRALLGTLPGAPLALLDRLYWRRVRALREAEARGQSDARERIEELNAALAAARCVADAPAAVMSPERHGAAEPALLARRGVRVLGATLLLGASLLLGVAVAWALEAAEAAGWVFDAGAGAGAVALGLGGGATLAARVLRGRPGGGGTRTAAGGEDYATFYLAPGAAPEDVRVAYDTLREHALADRAQGDIAMLDRLERLERAYQSTVSSGGPAYRRK